MKVSKRPPPVAASSPARKAANVRKTNSPFGTLTTEKRWVVWNAEQVKGEKGKPGRTTKIPYTLKNRMASSTDEKTWATYDEVKAAAPYFSGIGVIFTPAQTLLGIDIDHVLLESGALAPERKKEIETLIREAKTYTEISPSGTGLHLYLALSAPLALESNRHAPYEAYTSGRFFTVSERPYGVRKVIRTVSPDEALKLLAGIGYPWSAAPSEAGATQSQTQLDPHSYLDDDDLLTKMFASKNGADIKALYDGDASAYKDDLSRADAGLLAHLAFWANKDAAQIEHLWLASPLGAREKTQERTDYRKRSINAAIANCKETFTPGHFKSGDLTPDILDSLDLLYTITEKKEKSYTQNTENMCRILKRHPEFSNTLRYDSFTTVFEIKKSTPGTDVPEWVPFRDSDAVSIQTRISVLFNFFRKVGKEMVYDAIVQVSEENAIDSARDYVAALKWDGTPRLDQWLTHTYGTPDDEYHHAVASNWMKGLIKRIVVPGCKFDYVLVLEGPQGVKKSTSLHVLGSIPHTQNSWHVETTMSTDSKDFFMQFAGKAIIEFSEGETLSRTEVKKMKAIITMQSDKYRPPYGRVSIDFPRRCVFAMTTNQEQYLKDETGNRRWLPITVVLPEANIEWLASNKDQLWAEAYERVIRKDESVHDFPKEATLAAQNARRVSDPNEDRIREWYYDDNFMGQAKREEGITVQMVFAGALSQFGPLKKYDEMAITDVLKNALTLIKKRKMINGVQQMRWFPPAAIEFPLSQTIRSEYVNTSEFPDEDLPFNDES